MVGLIDESHFAAAERCFPGIRRFYDRLRVKPATFLELVWQYQNDPERSLYGAGGNVRKSRKRQAR
jgi:hypothetical protein